MARALVATVLLLLLSTAVTVAGEPADDPAAARAEAAATRAEAAATRSEAAAARTEAAIERLERLLDAVAKGERRLRRR